MDTLKVPERKRLPSYAGTGTLGGFGWRGGRRAWHRSPPLGRSVRCFPQPFHGARLRALVRPPDGHLEGPGPEAAAGSGFRGDRKQPAAHLQEVGPVLFGGEGEAGVAPLAAAVDVQDGAAYIVVRIVEVAVASYVAAVGAWILPSMVWSMVQSAQVSLPSMSNR